MTGNDQEHGKAPLITTALDHAWRWYELRLSCGLQLLNFFMLTISAIIPPYDSSLKARNDVISVAVPLIGGRSNSFCLSSWPAPGQCGSYGSNSHTRGGRPPGGYLDLESCEWSNSIR